MDKMKKIIDYIKQISNSNCLISATKIDTKNSFSWCDIEDYLISEHPDAILLDSQEKAITQTNRYSIIGFNVAFCVYTKYNSDGTYTSYVEDADNNAVIIDDALEYLSETTKSLKNEFYKDTLDDLPFYCGFMGMISYDYQCHLPKNKVLLPDVNNRIGHPVLMFRFCTNSIIRDLKDNSIYLTGFNTNDLSEDFIFKLKNHIHQKSNADKKQQAENKNSTKEFKSNISYKQYISDLNNVHNAIYKGDVYQINYTARYSTDYSNDPIDLYRRLRKVNPAPYAAFFKCNFSYVVSSSPELFIKVQDRSILTKPIKGTIKKTDDKKQNVELINILKNSKKDKSELLMIVDLERNDFSKICKSGSVKVTKLFEIEEYPTLYHLVSQVEGQLEETISFADIIKATFPGGSITGAPKLSAINHIRQLEHSPRELYTGSIGYIDISENMQFNIVIRTVIVSDGKAYISAGGGIVWDSDPDSEYSESLLKARVFKAVLCS